MSRLSFHIAAALFSVLIASGCSRNYRMDGNVELYGFDGEKLYLVTHENDVFTVVDSCCVRHGHFSMKGKADSTVFAVLCHGFEPVLPLFIERGRMQVRIAPTDLQVKGTRLNDQLYEFLERKNDIDNRYEDILQRSSYFTNRVNPSVSYDDSLKSVVSEAEDYIFGFVRKHYTDPLGVCVFMMMCDGMAMREPTPLIRRILDNAPAKFLGNRSISNYVSSVGYKVSD